MNGEWTAREVRDHLPQHTTLLLYYGGKSHLATKIVGMMPPHRRYIELFFGGGSVLFHKPRVHHEVINDRDEIVTTFWRLVRDDAAMLRALLWATPYGRQEFTAALDRVPTGAALEDARRFFIRQNQGFSGKAETPGNFGTGLNIYRQRPEVMSKWQTKIEMLRAAADRLRDAIIEHDDATRLLRRYVDATTGPETLIYADPPYMPDTRLSTDDYTHEMTEADHVQLLTELRQCGAMVLLSGYATDLYHDVLVGWQCTTWDVAAHSSGRSGIQKGQPLPRRTECLWRNPAACAALDRQPRMFD